MVLSAVRGLYILTVGDGLDVNNDVVRLHVMPNGFLAPEPETGEPTRDIQLLIALYAQTASDLWSQVQAINRKLQQARALAKAHRGGGGVTLGVRIRTDEMVYFDIVDGTLNVDERYPSGREMLASLQLRTLPYARGERVTLGETEILTNPGTVRISNVPGDVDALARIRVIDESENDAVINRIQLSRRAGWNLLPHYFEPVIDLEPDGSGVEHEDGSDYIGDGFARVEANPSWQTVARAVRPVEEQHGRFALSVRARDPIVGLGGPDDLNIIPGEPGTVAIRQVKSVLNNRGPANIRVDLDDRPRASSRLVAFFMRGADNTVNTPSQWTQIQNSLSGDGETRLLSFHRTGTTSRSVQVNHPANGTTHTQSPSSGISSTPGTGSPWENPHYATYSGTSFYAQAAVPAGSTTASLRLANMGFNIPTDALISSVTIRVHRSASGPNAVHDNAVQLIYNNANYGSNMADTSEYWPSTHQNPGTKVYTASSMGPSIVNDPTFGLRIQVESTSSVRRTARVYWVEMEVAWSHRIISRLTVFELLNAGDLEESTANSGTGTGMSTGSITPDSINTYLMAHYAYGPGTPSFSSEPSEWELRTSHSNGLSSGRRNKRIYTQQVDESGSYQHSMTASTAAPWGAHLMAFEVPAGEGGSLPPGAYTYVVLAYDEDENTGEFSSLITVNLSVTGANELDWQEVQGAAGYRVYWRRDGGDWQWLDAGDSISFRHTTESGSTDGDPESTLYPSELRLRITSGATGEIYRTLDPVQFQLSQGRWEELLLGVEQLPPVIALENGDPDDWLVVVQARNAHAATPMIDVDSLLLVPDDEPQLQMLYRSTAGIEMRNDVPRIWVADTRRDLRSTTRLLSISSDELIATATHVGRMLLAPGDNMLTLNAAIADGVSNVRDARFRAQISYVPRYRYLSGRIIEPGEEE